jgi:hypothetical protein
MKALVLLSVLCVASTVHAQQKDAPKPVPPITGKAEARNGQQKPAAPKQEITITLPSSLNVNLGGKLDVKTESHQTSANQESNRWSDPITLFDLARRPFVAEAATMACRSKRRHLR